MIIISAESCCDLSDEYIKTHNVKIMTHSIVTQRGQFYDGFEVTGRNIIDYKQRKGRYPKSKPPKVEDYRSEFSKNVGESENVVIHITPGIQGYKSYGNASYAAKNFSDVYVFDSSQISYGYGLVVMEACRLRDSGYDVTSILRALEKYKTRIRTYMIIRDFDCLYNIDVSIAKFAGVMKFFNICPYFCIESDKYVFKGVVFGGKLFYRDFVNKIVRRTKKIEGKVVVTAKYNSKAINELGATLVRFAGEEFKDTPIMQVSCSEACRYGEDMLGIAGIIYKGKYTKNT